MRTKSSRAAIAVAAIALAVAAACTPAGPKPEQTADAIYTGGDIVTVNDAQPTAEALAVKDGKILAVGAKADIEKAHRGATTQVVDLGGKTLLPGFLDAHSHYINSLLVANQCKLYAPPSGPGKDVESIVAELKKFAEERKIPKGEDDHRATATTTPSCRTAASSTATTSTRRSRTTRCGSTTCRCTARC